MPPQKKRKRVPSPAPETKFEQPLEQLDLTVSSDVYFEDGNIVLVAENIAFRVHQSQMERHSEVLSKMFVNAQKDPKVTCDGCPVVRLSDGQNAVRDLLLALYGTNPFLEPDESVIFNVFTISTKYHIGPLRLSAISAMRQFYPDTLSGWDRNRDKQLALQNVLTQANAEIFLPAAYYRLCQYDPELVLSTLSLPPSIVEAYFLGKTALVTNFASFLQRVLIDDGKTRHKGYGQCRSAWGSVQEYAHSLLRKVEFIKSPDPLLSLLKVAREVGSSKICHDCRIDLAAAIETERKAVWNGLPQVFRLKVRTWKELREML